MSRALAVADCETDPFKIGRVPAPFIWGYFDGVKYSQFTSTKAFVKFARKQRVILYAHNGGKFDWHFILPELERYSDIMIINGRIAKVDLGLCELRDSYNILPIPLAAYKKDDIDYAIMEPNQRHRPENWKKICAYLRSDCLYLYELIYGFTQKYGVQITQASAAMKQWKEISGKALPSSSAEFYDTIYPYYYGGRVECFETGIINDDFSVYDINSAYPFAMMHKHPYSVEYDHVEGYVKGADFYKVRARSCGAFPYRGDGSPTQAAGLRFPADGEMRTFTITSWEFAAAMDTGCLPRGYKVLESFLFGDHTDFRQYIEHFYQMRLRAKAEKNDAESLFAKLLMNSLYGKFAANPENYKRYMIVPMDVIAGLEAAGWEFAGEFGPWGLAQAPLLDREMHYYNVATGASITGFVRAMLWRAIKSSKGVLYCDTDSLAVRKRGRDIVIGDALGQWKHEGDFDRAGIAGKKLYIFRGAAGWWTVREGNAYRIVHSAKRPKNAVPLVKDASKGARLTQSEIWEVARGKVVSFTSDVPTFSVNKAPQFVTRNIRSTT